MDIILSPVLVPYETGALIGSLLYIIGYIGTRLLILAWRVYGVMRHRQIIANRIEEAPAVKIPEASPPIVAEEDPRILTSEEKQTIGELATTARLHIARGEFHDARARIIEGLSIDKFHKELNILLASLYEIDRDYKKAELV